MDKRKYYMILFSFLLLFAGCSNSSTMVKDNTEVSKIENDDNKTIPFEYFFRGFITLNENQAEAYPSDTYIIQTDEDWHDFMDKYVPGIEYYLSVDYSKECLIFSVLFPAKPSYSFGADIKSYNIVDDNLEPEYVEHGELGISDGIYAQNKEDIEHCFVNIVKVNKKYISKDFKNIYHKR